MTIHRTATMKWEILAMLSSVPLPVASIAADLTITELAVRNHIRELQKKYAIETAENGAVAWISRAGIEKAQQRAERYFEARY